MHTNSYYVPFLVATWAFFVTALFFNAAAMPNLDPGIYRTHNDGMGVFFEDDDVVTDINPSNATFIIWGPIYLYQLLWLLYATACVFRRSSETGAPLFTVAPVIHWSIFLMYIINNIANLTWFLLLDRGLIEISIINLILMAVTMFVATGLVLYRIHKYYPQLVTNGFGKETQYVYGFVANAFMMYGTWVFIAIHLTVARTLQHKAGLSSVTSGTIALSSLAVHTIVFGLIDFRFYSKHTRFLFTQYIVLIWGLTGIFINKPDPSGQNAIFTLLLLIASVILLLVKIGYVITKEKSDPAFPKVIHSTHVVTACR